MAVSLSNSNTSLFKIGLVIEGTKVLYSRGEALPVGNNVFYMEFDVNYHEENIPNELGIYSEYVVTYGRDELCQIVARDLFPLYKMLLRKAMGTSCESAEMYIGLLLKDIFVSLSDVELDESLRAFYKRLLVLLIVCIRAGSSMCNYLLNTFDCRHGDMVCFAYDNVLNTCSLEDLASSYNCSLTTFKAEFRRCFKCSPHRWFMERRMEYARQLLEHTTKSISEVAAESMYPNTSYFVKLFRRHYLLTPSEYRQKLGEE